MDENFVEKSDACPNCGTRIMDCLVWINDNEVECQICGTIYKP